MQSTNQNTKKNSIVKKIVYNIMLFSMLHSSFIVPAQNIVYAYLNQEEGLHYKGFKQLEEASQIASDYDEKTVEELPKAQKKSYSTKSIRDFEEDIISSDVKHGFIGVTKENPLDDPTDNIFKFFINDLPNNQTKVYLTYELYGLQDYYGVSRSINDRLSTGGHIIKSQQGWTLQKEEINIEWLKKGENRIMFSIPQGANLQYQIKNLKIEFGKKDGNLFLPALATANPTVNFIKDNKLYVKGFLRNIVSKEASVFIEDLKLSLNEGEFEGFLELTETLKQRKFAVIKAVDGNGLLGQEIINFDNLIEADKLFPLESSPEKATFVFDARKGGTLKIEGASIIIKDSTLSEDKEINITHLRKVDVAPMASGMINVTKGGSAYRFLPDGTRFNKMVSIAIEYDEKLIPKGYSTKDIKTFYFNTDSKSWIPVTKDTINEKEKTVISLTDHFTDYVNGIIQTPESPETAGFTPTMMNDIKAADPSSEITLISPPQVSQKGDANISYPIKIPSGRNGMQPQIAVQYSNEGGNGWLGQGWNINIPAITIDTRWGIPVLDPVYESEIYTLNGEQLMYPKVTNLSNQKVDWMPNRHYDATTNQTTPETTNISRITNAIFTPRKQGSFSKIERLGNNPSDYYWKVTNVDGTVSWYGRKPGVTGDTTIKDELGRIVHWGLFLTEDVYGNNIIYSYDTLAFVNQSGVNSNLNDGKKFNINKITYTGYKNTEIGKYEILFEKSSVIRMDPIINGRLGVKQIDPYFLSNIIVRKTGSALGVYIRKYVFDMGYGKFKKGQLKAIREFDKDGVEFYKHDFEYYDDLGVRKTLFKEAEYITLPSFNADFSLGMGNTLNASRINSSESTEYGYEARPAGGIQINNVTSNPSNLLTLGFPFGESKTKSSGKITMIDMDGNGLDDILFKKNNTLRYYPHFVNSNDGTHFFDSNYKSLININNFNKTEGFTKTMALESIDFRIRKYYVGKKRFKTKEESKIYITDGNGDMLPDIVSNKKVYFNKGVSGNSNTFVTSSSLTPNMLITASVAQIDPNDVEDPEEEVNEDTFYDVVRVWQAPFTGTIQITDNIQFLPVNSDSKATYSIETAFSGMNNNLPFRIYIKEFNSSVTTDNMFLAGMLPNNIPLGTTNYPVRVDRGQKIYFRIHKNEEEVNDILKTNPKIEYIGVATELHADQNGFNKTVYKYGDDFVLSDSQSVIVPSTGNVSISWPTITVANPSDSVYYRIIKEITDASGGIQDFEIYGQSCPINQTTQVLPSAAISNYSINSMPANGYMALRFEVYSASNVKWKNIQWKPVFVYTPDSNAISQDVTDVITKYPVPNYSIYQESGLNNYTLVPATSPYTWQVPATSTTFKALPNTYIHPSAPQLGSTDNGSFTFVAKRNGSFLGSTEVMIQNGVISLSSYTPITIYTGVVNTTNTPIINFEFYAEGPINLALFEKYLRAVIYHPNYASDVNELGNGTPGTGTVIIGHQSEWNANYSFSDYTHYYRFPAKANHTANKHLGAMNRGWGQFLYNDACDTSSMPEDQYSKLINNQIINNYVENNTNIINVLGIDISGCNSSNVQQMEDCIEDQINNNLNIPSEETVIDENNIDQIVDSNLNNLDITSLQQSYCMMPMHALRYVNQASVMIEKWIGHHDAQYSADVEMRDGDFSDSGLAGYFNDPAFDDIESPELLSDAETGMNAINLVQRSVAVSLSAGRGAFIFSKSKSSYSNTVSDFMDLNGDRYPDLLTSDKIQSTNMTGGHRDPLLGNYGYNPLRGTSSENSTLAISGSYPIAGRKDIEAEKQDSGNPSVSLGMGISANLSGDNEGKESLLDLNGDGLPERLFYDTTSSQYKYKLNLGKPFSNTTLSDVFPYYLNHKTKPDSAPNPSFNLTVNFNDLGALPFNISTGYSSSSADTETSFQDINGDGLVDLLRFHDNDLALVQFNLGNSFSSEQIHLSYEPTGTDDLSLYNNINSNSASVSGSGSFFTGFPIFTLLFVTVFAKFGITLGGNGNLTISETNREFKDFNGDGYPDYVEKDGNNLKVYYSKIGRTDMLKTVKNPIGGQFTIDYQPQKVDYNNPTAKWAMTQVTIEDGYDKINDGQDTYIKQFSYENGVYDRRERQFYGYETVKTFDPLLYRTTVSKYHNKSYFLNGLLKESYIIAGDDETQKFSSTQNFYNIRELDATNTGLTLNVLPDTFDVGGTEGRRSAAVLLTKTKNYFYELSPTPLLTTEVNLSYDSLGRVVTYENLGNINDPTDNYTSTIAYHSNSTLNAKHILNVPSSITVNATGVSLRKRTTTVDAFGDILTVNAYASIVSPVTFVTTTMKYNAYGHLTEITFPPNDNNEAMFYKYTYDASEFNKYITKIEDAFGNTTQAKYDSNFDKVIETTDIAGNKIYYTYDAKGRSFTIQAPKEVAASKPYTIKFLYYLTFGSLPANSVTNLTFVPVALTKHYDEQNPTNDIETYTFIDGLARPIQIKKDIYIDTNNNPSSPQFTEALSASGKVAYDEFGRTIRQYHPHYHIKTDNTKFLLYEYNAPLNSSTEYDEIDRPIQTIDPAGSISTFEYSIDEDVDGTLAIKTRSVVTQNDSQDIIAETYKDVSGSIISTMNLGSNSIWTKFDYNAIGELLSYTDAEAITTSYEYDLLGRKETVNHPDNGITKFKYDKAGNMTSLETANLTNEGTSILYDYFYNRLIKIKFPDTPSGDNISNVYYQYGDTGNQKGKVICQKDATGEQIFDYGNMGEMVYNKRKVVGPNIPTREFETYFKYDSWNRLQNMTYPDGEKVTYFYDLGGNLNKVAGELDGQAYQYVKRIDYDFYEQRTYLLYGNNTETFYSYTPELRRLNKLIVKTSDQQDLFSNSYKYDKVGNVTDINNSAGITSNAMGGIYNHKFAYDKLNRLVNAEGDFTGSPSQLQNGNDSYSDYNLTMKYNNTHGIVEKIQSHYKNTATYTPNTYQNAYEYFEDTHKVKAVNNGSTQEIFEYDLNGNIKRRIQQGNGETEYYWDEANRLRVVSGNHSMQHYIYDAAGERVLKAGSDVETIFENGSLIAPASITLNGYTTYPSAFLVIDPNGIYSKHYYAGSQRIVSRLGEEDARIFEQPEPTPYCAGLDARAMQQAQIKDLSAYVQKIGLAVRFKDYKGTTYQEEEKALADEALEDNPGQQRAPTATPIYYYHPDHLGTSTFLTDFNGNAYQFFLNLPFGETMAEQHPDSYYKTPFKFSGKELDEETGLYYFGARYYDSRTSIWLSVDPLMEKYPNWNPYNYTMQNPINLVDPTGMGPEGREGDPPWWEKLLGSFLGIDGGKMVDDANKVASSKGKDEQAATRLDATSKKVEKVTKALETTTEVLSQTMPNGQEALMIANFASGRTEEGFQEVPVTAGIFLMALILPGDSNTYETAAKTSSRILSWGSNAKGHLIKHADALGFKGYSAQQLQKMLPQLRSAVNQLYNNVNPALTRIGRWGGQADDVLMHITNNGKMLVTKQNGEFITVINKTSNNWYQLAKPLK